MRIVKNKKRKVKKHILIVAMLLLAVVAKISLGIILETQKNNIIINIQDAERRISELEKENTTLRIEIQGLQNKDAIYDYMIDNGYTQDMDNVIYIGK